MGRPRRDHRAETEAANEVYEGMRRTDEELIGLVDDIEAAMLAGFRPADDEAAEDPPKAGPVTTYRAPVADVVAAWGDSEKMRDLCVKARGRA